MAGESHPVGDADTTKTEIARKFSTDTPKRPPAQQAELNSRLDAFKDAQREAKTQDAGGWRSGTAGWNANNNADTAKVQLADYTPDGGGFRAPNAVWKPGSGKPAQAQTQPRRSLPEVRAGYYITNRTHGGVLDINRLAKNLRDVAQEPGGQATVNAVMDKVKKDWSPEVQAQLQLRMAHSQKVSEFFDPVRDNPHFETLKKACLLGENASVADFYNLKYDLGQKSLGEVEGIAQKHGLTIDQLNAALTEGSRGLGDRAFNTFRSFIQDPGFVGGKYAAHEADLKKAMVDAGVKPEHADKLFNEMQQIAFPPNSLDYGQRKAISAWTDALGVAGNSGGGAIGDAAKLRPRPLIKPQVPASEGGKFAQYGTGLFTRRPASFEPMDQAQFNRIKEAFTRQGGTIDISPEAVRYLETRGVEAVTFNDKTILMKPNASPSTVYEELIHATQHRTGQFSRWTAQYGNAGAIARSEYDAAAQLVRNQKAYGISDAEHAVNVQRMAEFAAALRKMGVPVD